MDKMRNLGIALITFSIILIFILSLVKADVDTQASALCDIYHSNPDLDITQCPAHQSNVSWLLTGSFGIAFLVLGVGTYMSLSRPVVEKKEFKQVDLSKLSDDERKVYDVIKNKQGSIYQSDLIKEAAFTKVKTSRILDRLEQKGILEKKRRGMTNIVVLK